MEQGPQQSLRWVESERIRATVRKVQVGSVALVDSGLVSASVSVELQAFRRPAGLGTPHVGTPIRGRITYCSRIQPTMMPIKRRLSMALALVPHLNRLRARFIPETVLRSWGLGVVGSEKWEVGNGLGGSWPYCLIASLPYCPTAPLPHRPTAPLPHCPIASSRSHLRSARTELHLRRLENRGTRPQGGWRCERCSPSDGSDG